MRPLTTENQSCFSCAFWAGVQPQRIDDRNVVFNGQCRKNAPVLMPDGSAGWPNIGANGWCAVYEQGQTPNEAQRFL